MKSTSKEAYTEAIRSGTIQNDYTKIYNVLRFADKPLTYTEIASKLNWYNPNKVSRRMSELVKLGLIIEEKPRKCSIVNSNCTTYLINKLNQK